MPLTCRSRVHQQCAVPGVCHPIRNQRERTVLGARQVFLRFGRRWLLDCVMLYGAHAHLQRGLCENHWHCFWPWLKLRVALSKVSLSACEPNSRHVHLIWLHETRPSGYKSAKSAKEESRSTACANLLWPRSVRTPGSQCARMEAVICVQCNHWLYASWALPACPTTAHMQ